MDNKIVPISKNKIVENEEIYNENFFFLDKVVNYEMKTLYHIEKVYEGKTNDSQISELIHKEKKRIIWPILSTMFSMFLFTIMMSLKNIYFIFPTIIVTALSIFLFSRYFNESNSKINIIFRVYQEVIKKDYIYDDEIISLQKLIKKEDMLDILREHEMRIPMKKVLSALQGHFLIFKDYKAMKNYNYLQELENRKKNNKKN